jgi:hypothetical protein
MLSIIAILIQYNGLILPLPSFCLQEHNVHIVLLRLARLAIFPDSEAVSHVASYGILLSIPSERWERAIVQQATAI